MSEPQQERVHGHGDWHVAAIIGCLVVGSFLRLLWPADMEWKGDEQWMFTHALDFARHGTLPWVGMASGARVTNPGLSIWPFVAFAHWTNDPIRMVQWVQWLNVVALWEWAAFAWRRVADPERRTWLWGIALFAVSPLPIVFSRKLWAQDLLPVLAVPLLWCHSYRRTVIGAFGWGVCGALIGQLHMSGFFFAFSVLLATVLYPPAREGMRASAWLGWLAGSAVGVLPLLPWLVSLAHPGPSGHGIPLDARHLLSLRAYTDWFLNGWGIDAAYSMKRFFWHEFLRYPFIAGHPTYGMAIVHLALVALAACTTIAWICSRFRPRPEPALTVYLLATGVIYCLLITLSLLKFHAHYLIVVSPFVHIWVATLLRDRPTVRSWVVALQLSVSTTFLGVVHVRGGIPNGDYGTSYGTQRTAGTYVPAGMVPSVLSSDKAP